MTHLSSRLHTTPKFGNDSSNIDEFIIIFLLSNLKKILKYPQMFGESESDSPRVGSPWDSLLSSGASTPSSLSGISDNEVSKIYKLSLPKLVPEAEEVIPQMLLISVRSIHFIGQRRI